MRKLRSRRPSGSMLVALLALFVALGGSSYAALKITSANIQNGTIQGVDIHNSTITGSKLRYHTLNGRQINASRLGTVPTANNANTANTAANASTLGGRSPSAFKVACPAGTTAVLGLCFETAQRTSATYFNALSTCQGVDRRLPTMGELLELVNRPGFGITVREISENGGFDSTGAYYVAVGPISGVPAAQRRIAGGGTPDTDPFRCVTNASN